MPPNTFAPLTHSERNLRSSNNFYDMGKTLHYKSNDVDIGPAGSTYLK